MSEKNTGNITQIVILQELLLIIMYYATQILMETI